MVQKMDIILLLKNPIQLAKKKSDFSNSGVCYSYKAINTV